MTTEYTFKSQELEILKNFQIINNSAIIKPNKFSSATNSKTIISFYKFEDEYEFSEYGIYDLQQFNQVLNSFKNSNISESGHNVVVTDADTNSKVTYRTTPLDHGMILTVKDPGQKFDKVPKTVEFTFSSEKIAALRKMGDVLKTEKIYFETKDTDDILVTAAGPNKNASEYIFDEVIGDNNIDTNNLSESILVFNRDEYNMIHPGYDYKVEISIHPQTGSCLSRWTNTIMTGLVYYIALDTYK